MSETLHLGNYEQLLGVTSALISHFADCIALEDDVEVDDGLLTKIEEICISIEALHSQKSIGSVESIQKMRTLWKNLREVQEDGFGCYEADMEDCQALSEAYDAIRDYCEEEWEKRRIATTGSEE